MKIVGWILVAITGAVMAGCLTGCGVPISVVTPYGDITSDKGGNVTITPTPVPIVIPVK